MELGALHRAFHQKPGLAPCAGHVEQGSLMLRNASTVTGADGKPILRDRHV